MILEERYLVTSNFIISNPVLSNQFSNANMPETWYNSYLKIYITEK